MNTMNYPFVVAGLSFALLWLSALIGASFRRRRKLPEDDREDFSLVIAATLTLLGLIIGFSFSMAVSRYDLRKNYEEAEANAIGTEYVRADLLPAADAERIRLLLRQYLDERVMFYRIRDSRELQHINAVTSQLQTDLWNSVKSPAEAKPTPVVALAVSGMNDVLNSQGYTQAAWWNRIPIAAWGLMMAIAICCNLLIGYGALHAEAKSVRLIVLPLVASISFLLIADIDSPRSGIIHVSPQNLLSLAQSIDSP